MTYGPVGGIVTAKLKAALMPLRLEVIDESGQHAGHAGADARGESHFRVRIVAAAFAGKSRIERHRLVNAILAEELRTRIHALAVEAKAPEEDGRLSGGG